ncbi:MAG: hypothetical protein HY430_02300 [Candidatus Levybacteria bacterium]|nr:hypothetical protein [Candidatus Levybacteria bacterium]
MSPSERRDSPQSIFPTLSLQERAIGAGMLLGKTTVTNYRVAPDGSRIAQQTLNEHDLQSLAHEYRKDPFARLAYARNNVLAIMEDTRQPLADRKERAKRYTDAFLNLQVRLDRMSYPGTDQVQNGVPEYIPDGLSDMGSEEAIDPRLRHREKIRIDKTRIFAKYRLLFHEIFTEEVPRGITSEQWKKYVTQKVAREVFSNMPYNYGGAPVMQNRSVRVDDIIDQKLSVCRHHALVTQVLLQGFGITGRLLKSDVNFSEQMEPHANNLVRIEGKWHLLDSTAPERSPDGNYTGIFLKPIPEKHIDLNKHIYTWKIPEANGRMRVYQSRSNMFYRIRDNVQNPT